MRFEPPNNHRTEHRTKRWTVRRYWQPEQPLNKNLKPKANELQKLCNFNWSFITCQWTSPQILGSFEVGLDARPSGVRRLTVKTESRISSRSCTKSTQTSMKSCLENVNLWGNNLYHKNEVIQKDPLKKISDWPQNESHKRRGQILTVFGKTKSNTC